MTELDVAFARSNFPAFKEPSLEDWGFFENAGGSYACGQVIERLERYYRTTKVQPYGHSDASREAGELMDNARQRMAGWLNVADNEVHFGPSTSQNTYVVAQALRQHLQPGDEIIITNQDHEANIGVWQRLEADGMVIREWRVDPETAQLDVADLKNLLNEKTRVVAFTHCSNLVGSMHPVAEWIEWIHQAGAMAVVDGVSYCGHGLPDVAALGADIYLFSLYKVFGPHQGVMVMRQAANTTLPNQGHFFNDHYPTARFTPAGPDHAQIAAINGVQDYFEVLDRHHFEPTVSATERSGRVLNLLQTHERHLLQPLLDFLSTHPKVRLLGSDQIEDRAPTVAFTVAGWQPADLAERLAARKLYAGAGHFYAYRLVKALGIAPDQGVLRVSFVHYTEAAEVSRLIEVLDELI